MSISALHPPNHNVSDNQIKTWGGGREDGQDPELKVFEMLDEFCASDRIGSGVVAVAVDACLDYVDVTGSEEGAVVPLQDLVGEIDDGKICNDPKDHGDDAFDDEDPSPSTEIANTVHLHETICKD